jgi:hypothetical protein
VIVDFSQVPPGSKLILYNDAPAPVPAFDPRYDYYTGNPDQTDDGGAPTTPEGYGPNTRTIMQFQVNGTPAAPFDLAALNHSFPAAYAASQPGPVVPEVAYGAATNTYSTIFNNSLTFTPMGSAKAVTINFQPKAIQELFDPYGRMNATLGVEIPRTTLTTQTTIPYGYIDPPTETISMGTPQIWKITHNGVDTHAIHFHLFNVQVINRVGWDGMVKPPDPNELGWKETVRMNPLEDVIVVFRPEAPWLPFSITNSVRPLDPTSRIGSTAGFMGIDPSGNPVTVINVMTDFGWEYAWHCHLLGHEENDMMRPIVMTGVKDYVKPVQIPPTWWLQQYYGNQRRPTNLASVYIAGLNPTNPASVLKFVSATLQPDRQEIKVVFGPTVANRVYTLYGASSLMGPWTPIYARVAGYPDAMDLIVPTSSQMSFFRLSVNLP